MTILSTIRSTIDAYPKIGEIKNKKNDQQSQHTYANGKSLFLTNTNGWKT